MTPKLTWRDLVFAQLDGFYVIPLGIAIALMITVVPLAIERAITLL